MRPSQMLAVAVAAAGVVVASPLKSRDLGGEVVIRLAVAGGDTHVDTTVKIDLTGDLNAQALQGMAAPKQFAQP
jgi:hypothetical protein